MISNAGKTINFFLFVLLVVACPNISVASDPYDQRCISTSENFIEVSQPAGLTLSQTFTPSKNRLSRISAYLRGTGSGNFYFSLYKGDNFIASTSPTPEPNGSIYVSQYFTQDIVVYPGDSTYKIVPGLSGDNSSLYWNFQSDCYSGGIAYHGDGYLNNNPIWDFGFVVFGHDFTPTDSTPPAISPEIAANGDASSQANQSTVSTNSSQASGDAAVDSAGNNQTASESNSDQTATKSTDSSEALKNWSVIIILCSSIMAAIAVLLLYLYANKKWPFSKRFPRKIIHD